MINFFCNIICDSDLQPLANDIARIVNNPRNGIRKSKKKKQNGLWEGQLEKYQYRLMQKIFVKKGMVVKLKKVEKSRDEDLRQLITKLKDLKVEWDESFELRVDTVSPTRENITENDIEDIARAISESLGNKTVLDNETVKKHLDWLNGNLFQFECHLIGFQSQFLDTKELDFDADILNLRQKLLESLKDNWHTLNDLMIWTDCNELVNINKNKFPNKAEVRDFLRKFYLAFEQPSLQEFHDYYKPILPVASDLIIRNQWIDKEEMKKAVEEGKENEKLNEENEKLNDEIKRLKIEVDILKEEKGKLKEKLNDKTNKVDILNEEKDKLRDELRNWEKKSLEGCINSQCKANESNLRNKIRKWKKKYENEEKNCNEQRDKLEKSKTDRDKLNQANRTIAQLNVTVTKLRKEKEVSI